MQNRFNSRLEQNTKIVNNGKKFIFKKLHFQILGENSKKTDPNLKEISDLRLSSHIGRKEIEYQRLLKVSWLLEKKYQKYLKSQKLETYQIKDIIEVVNSMLAKNNYKTVAKSTIQKDLKKLIKMGLVANYSKSFGKNNGGFSLYKPNTNIWQHRVEIIRGYFENEIRDYTKDKRIVTVFKKEIDEHTFPKVNSSNNTPSNTTLIYNIKDSNKIKNSIENFSIKNNKNFTENNQKKEKIEKQKIEKENLIEKKEKKEKMKFTYKTSFAEYQETKLTTKYKISPNHFVDLYRFSNNSNTYTNALINLECFLVYLSQEYHVNDIVKFYVAKFKTKYKSKIWFTSPKSKVNDFFDLVGEFKDNFKSVYKGDSEQRVVFQGQVGYFDGSIFRKVDSASNIAEIAQNFLEGLNNANCGK
ncbi:plasmid maintenance protein [Borreliella afzelii]|uniref:plasmid maintenance protein n=1 Tax=Borreliella afzelii TaxID=29518 RepID=UPI0002F16E6E